MGYDNKIMQTDTFRKQLALLKNIAKIIKDYVTFCYESNEIEKLVIKVVPFKLVQQIKVFCKKNRKF